MPHQRLELGAEQQRAASRHRTVIAVLALRETTALSESIVERLLAEAIPRQSQRALLPIPQRDGKHPHAALERRLDPPGAKRRQQRLRIRMPAPLGFLAPRSSELTPDVQ